MKGIDIFCASHAATAIRVTMDEAAGSCSSSSSNSSSFGRGRAIDRHNPIIRDERRIGRSALIPPTSCSSSSTTHKNLDKTKELSEKKTTSSSSYSKPKNDQKRRSVAFGDKNDTTSTLRKQQSWGCRNPGDFITPPPLAITSSSSSSSSSRYLLSSTDAAFFNVLTSEFDPLVTLPPTEPVPSNSTLPLNKDHHQFSPPPNYKPPSSSSSSSSSASPHQVVVLRVSLHCRGCERKMRKHISRMEGVTSFDIDFAAKKVTVEGDVTPLAVLASVSKVKNAQLLTPTTISSSSTIPVATSSNYSEMNKQQGIVV